MSRPDTPDRPDLMADLQRSMGLLPRPRRYDQCDDTCTVDCGHCKGAGRPSEPESHGPHCANCKTEFGLGVSCACSAPVSSSVDGQAVEFPGVAGEGEVVETPTISNRGFNHFDPITAWPDGYRGQVRVYESSAASHPCIWIAVEGNEHVHLTVEDAARLRDQIGYLIEHHYQLDSRSVVPSSARVDDETDGPPERPAICVHDVRGPLRQTCCCCGTCDHLDFRVTDEAWADVVPPELDGTHVCLRCFDAMAASRGIDYAKTLTEMCFVGDAAVFHFLPDSAITVGRSS